MGLQDGTIMDMVDSLVSKIIWEVNYNKCKKYSSSSIDCE